MKLRRLLPIGAILVFVAVMAGLETLPARSGNVEPADEMRLYKQAYWIMKDDPNFALAQANQLWTAHPTADAKLLLALAYVKAGQPERAHRLLTELQSVRVRAVTEEELSRLVEETDSERPISLVNMSAFTASATETAVEPGGTEASFSPWIDELLHRYIEKLKEEYRSVEDSVLETMALIDAERIDYIRQGSDSGSLLDEALEKYEEAVTYITSEEREDELHPAFREAIAESAVYFDDLRLAEELLAGILKQFPDDLHAKKLLASLYLDGLEEPGDTARTLPQFTEAERQLERSKRTALLERAEEAPEALLEEIADEGAYGTLGQEMANSLLSPYATGDDPQVHYYLSKYYFLQNELEPSSEHIEAIGEHQDKLDPIQQHFVQSLRQLPESSSDMTIEQMNRKHELTRETYSSLESLRGKRYYADELTPEEQAFSVHLSTELIQLSRSSIHITSIQTSGNQVELYVRSDNIELGRSGLQLFDNSTGIQDFALEKIGESSSFKRYIMLVLDQSGSMDGVKIETARSSAADFIEKLGENELPGVIVFSDGHDTIVPFTTDRSGAAGTMSGIEADGGTNIAPALAAAIQQLASERGERVAFILSDGEDSNFSDPAVRQELIKQARQAGVTIFAVGFDAGYETLRDVAEGTGGRYIGASDLRGLADSFAEISATLSRTYKITYSLERMDPGKHTVKMIHSGLEEKKTYFINEDGSMGGDGAADDEQQPELGSDKLYIERVNPNRVVISKSGTTKVRIEGNRFEDVEKVLLDGKEIDHQREDGRTISVNLPNNLAIGIHRVTLVSYQQVEVTTAISYTNSALQQSVAFGYATVYGDFLETKNDTVILMGNTSVDHFIYDSGGEMKLSDQKTLTFSGMSVQTGKSRVPFLPGPIEMERDDLGKEFSVASATGFGEFADRTSLERFGIEINVIPKFTYTAEHSPDQGTLEAKASIQGFSKVLALNSVYLEELRRNVKFLPTKGEVSLLYEPDGFIVAGTAAADLNVPQLANIANAELGLTYESAQNRIVFKGSAGGEVDFFGFPLKGNAIGINGIGVEVGLAFPLALNRLGVSLEASQGVPLGTTGLQFNKIGLMADWSDSREGSFGLGLSTIADRPVQQFINKINNLPIIGAFIELPEDICVVCAEGEIGVKKFGKPAWSFNGKLAMSVLDFEIAQNTIYFDRYEITFGAKMDIAVITYDAKASIVWKDPSFQNYTSLKFFGEVDTPGPNGKLAIVLIPAQISWSYLDWEAEVWGKNPHFRIGSELDVVA